FPDGAFWVPLAPISDPELVPSTIAHALGVHVGGKEDPLGRVLEHVRGKRMLLVLDNFEQILPPGPSVSALLASGPDLNVITSSRAPLRISRAQEFPVPPLDLLDGGRRRLFARGAGFVAGAMLEQLEPVCGPASEIGGGVLDRASELLDSSLIRQQDAAGEPRFRMLVTVREFANEKLGTSGEDATIRDRHLAAYLALAERAAPELQGNDQRRWLDLVELEHDNMRAALEHAIVRGNSDTASRLLFALWRFWQVRGYLREGLVWAERVLALAGSDPRSRMPALETAGGLAYWMGDLSATERYYREAYELAG